MKNNPALRKSWPAVQSNTTYTWRFYVRLSLLYFVFGGLVELLMQSSGFYKQDYTSKEDLEKALEKKRRKRQFLVELREQAGKKLEDKNLIPTPRDHGENKDE